MIHKGKNRSTLSGLVFVFVLVFSEKDTPNKSNKTRALLRELFRLELSTAEYTPLCKVEGHCFNGCGISPDNEIFCREVAQRSSFGPEGRDEISVPGILTVWKNAFRDGKNNVALFFCGF